MAYIRFRDRLGTASAPFEGSYDFATKNIKIQGLSSTGVPLGDPQILTPTSPEYPDYYPEVTRLSGAVSQIKAVAHGAGRVVPLAKYAPRFAMAGQPSTDTPFAQPDAADHVLGPVVLK